MCVSVCLCVCVCVELLAKDSLEFPIENSLLKVLYYGYPIKDSLLKDFISEEAPRENSGEFPLRF